MEENNRKGSGVFYAVVGVATLVVAIIGATFAFFSATATNSDAIVGGTATGNNIALAVKPIAPVTEGRTENMIPMLENNLQDGLTGTGGKSCIDSNGNTVCQVYKVTVTNNGATAVKLDATLNLTTAKGSGEGTGTNMKWQLIENATTEGSVGTMKSQGTAELFADNLSLAAGANQEYYIVVWLLETGGPQDSSDAGINYTGTVTVNAVGADGNSTTGLTATFASQQA